MKPGPAISGASIRSGNAAWSEDERVCASSRGFRRAVRLSLAWSLCFGLAVSAAFLAGGTWFIDFVSTNAEVRVQARDYLVFAALTPLVGAAAFAFDGIYIGATWTRAMRDLMLIAFAAYGLTLLVAGSIGNSGLWVAFLVFLAARGIGQAAFWPRLARQTFAVLDHAPVSAGLETIRSLRR